MLDGGYRLKLANGEGWHLKASEELRSWIAELAEIMELSTSESDGFQKLLFIKKNSDKKMKMKSLSCVDHHLRKDLPSQGWKVQDLFLLQLWSHDDVPDLICEIGNGDSHNLRTLRMRSSLYPIYHRVQASGGFPLHAALIEWNGIGILLAAANETGKSTCCRRLPGSWKALCDEESLIVRTNQRQYYVHPFPTWSNCFWRRSKQTWIR
jgi:SynChlorMet cassette protein ScmC